MIVFRENKEPTVFREDANIDQEYLFALHKAFCKILGLPVMPKAQYLKTLGRRQKYTARILKTVNGM